MCDQEHMQPEDKHEEYVFTAGNNTYTIIWICVYLTALAIISIGSFVMIGSSKGFIAPGIVFAVLFLLSLIFILFSSFVVISPNEAIVMVFCGKYMGSLKDDGCHFKNPFYSCQRISTKTMVVESDESKVNDVDGNPIICSATVVYKVDDTCKAAFAVEDYNAFLKKQIDTCLRRIIHSYPYDTNSTEVISLKSGVEQVNAELTAEIQRAVNLSGLQIISSRLSNLSYSAEIAAVMLKKQQAIALLQAREKIVKGAVYMIKDTMKDIEDQQIAELTNEYKQKIISQMLVVMVSDNGVSPVMSTS